MQFLADMCVSQRVCDWLRQAGHEVVHLRDEGLQRLANGDIFAKAVAEHRVLLTFDLDFGEIVTGAGSQIVSVIVFRLHNTRSPHVIERLRVVIDESAEAIQQGAIIVVEESRHRVRRFPIG